MCVLIVAKCNVNQNKKFMEFLAMPVLIVAKCNINLYSPFKLKGGLEVLIVAKCNVNVPLSLLIRPLCLSINSSKV